MNAVSDTGGIFSHISVDFGLWVSNENSLNTHILFVLSAYTNAHTETIVLKIERVNTPHEEQQLTTDTTFTMSKDKEMNLESP